MQVFITGATGYIGGSVAVRLIERGHSVRGLARSQESGASLTTFGIEPVVGTLQDHGLLAQEAARADAVINAANADEPLAPRVFADALAGSRKRLIHTSGSTVVADEAAGEPSDRVHVDIPAHPVAGKAARVAIDREVLAAAARGVRAMVICPTMIYGLGLGPKKHSLQVPMLIRDALAHGAARHVGRGLNRWSQVHIDDLADLYALAVERGDAGEFYFAENGEATLLEIARDISRLAGLGDPVSLPIADAIAAWGEGRAVYSLGSNSRVRADRARTNLGWAPRNSSLFHDLPREVAAHRGK